MGNGREMFGGGRRSWRLAAVLALLLLPPGRAAASDGVIEINQARALAGGVTPGDAAGFPVTLGMVGSYRLTSDLDLRDQPDAFDLTAIEVGGTHMTIDLNGFAILGPARCSGQPVTCDATGSGVGIRSNNPVIVVGGSVRGMGGDGLSLGNGAIVEGVRATGNGGYGIAVGAFSLVSECAASFNREDGIHLGGTGGVAHHNSVRGNGAAGIGFGLSSGGIAWRNAVSENGGTGISARFTHLVVDNTVDANAGSGVVVQAGSGYAGNVIANNGLGSVLGTGLDLGGNLCDGSLSCGP